MLTFRVPIARSFAPWALAVEAAALEAAGAVVEAAAPAPAAPRFVPPAVTAWLYGECHSHILTYGSRMSRLAIIRHLDQGFLSRWLTNSAMQLPEMIPT